MYGWMNGWMDDGWMNGQMNEQTDDRWIDGWMMDECLDKWMDEQLSLWVDGWSHRQIDIYFPLQDLMDSDTLLLEEDLVRPNPESLKSMN